MNAGKNFEFAAYLNKADDMARELDGLLKSVKAGRTEEPRQAVPEIRRIEDGAVLSVAFVGQYNAGKSTLIKALTGNENIPIEADVCTDTITAYNWRGVELLDTPGVQAGFPEHDQISEEQIQRSDLLVFVTTTEGFGENMAGYFRRLAFDEHRARETILVLNKKDEMPGGLEQKRADIEFVIEPLRCEDLQTVLVSAQDYLDASGLPEGQDRKELLEEAGFDAFVEALNGFIKEKDLFGRITTPLIEIRAIAREAAAEAEARTPEERAGVELLRRRIAIFRKSRARLRSDVEHLLEQALVEMGSLGDSLASEIEPGISEEDLKKRSKELEDKASDCLEKLRENIEQRIEEEYGQLEIELKELSQQTIAQELIKGAGEAFGAGDKSAPTWTGRKFWLNDKDTAASSPEAASIAGDRRIFVIKTATGPGKQTAWKISAAGGSQAHKAVYEVGKFFGYKFKPWEADGIAGKFGRVGQVLGVVGGILAVWSQIQEERRDAEEQRNLRAARDEIRTLYWDSATEIRAAFASQFAEFADDFYGTQVQDSEEKLEALVRRDSDRSEEARKLHSIANRATNLIREIQECS